MRQKPPRRPKAPPAVLVLGPILHARGDQGGRWRLSAAVVMGGEEEPTDLRVDGVGLPVPPRFLHDWGEVDGRHGRLRLWRYDFAVPRGAQDGRIGYGFDGQEQRWHVTIPGTDVPPRIAYAACGGAEDESKIETAGLSRNARWAHLLGRHRAEPFHLLLLGGDQVYADGLWERVPALAPVGALPILRRAAVAAVPDELPFQLDVWYLATYRHAWSQAEAAAVLASVPIVAMWDDHDIVDGWGSYPDPLLDCPAYKAIFAAASRAFRLFQVGMAEGDPPETVWGALDGPGDGSGGLSQGLILNGVGILAPDLRSERRPDRVLSPATRQMLPRWLERFRGCGHLLLMSSVPLVFPGFGLLERVLNLIPGHQIIEDDLRDQWRSPAHAEEWQWLVRVLALFARDAGCRVTVLSGEVHLGSVGVLRGPGVEIWQLISSGIVHPPPPDLLVRGMERMARGKENLFDGLELEMTGFPETGRRMLPTRNWLSLTLDGDGTLTAAWQAEGEPATLVRRLPLL
ncbi:MAG: hypothetical protein RLY86_2773 [Pseudomonadota bacterium]|jgi:hypothetical protein